MRNFKGLLVLALAIGLVIGVSTSAKAVSFPTGIETYDTMTDWLTSLGVTYDVSPIIVDAPKWRVTALAYEAGYIVDYFDGQELLFKNRTDTSPNAFGDWVNLSGDPEDTHYWVENISASFAFDWEAEYLWVVRLTSDLDYLDQTFTTGTYIVGFDDTGAGPDDNHDDLIMAFQAVPIPGAVWLLGSGLVGLAGLRRKFRS